MWSNGYEQLHWEGDGQKVKLPLWFEHRCLTCTACCCELMPAAAGGEPRRWCTEGQTHDVRKHSFLHVQHHGLLCRHSCTWTTYLSCNNINVQKGVQPREVVHFRVSIATKCAFPMTRFNNRASHGSNSWDECSWGYTVLKNIVAVSGISNLTFCASAGYRLQYWILHCS